MGVPSRTLVGPQKQTRSLLGRPGGPRTLQHPQCPHCGKNHSGECWRQLGVCFHCQQPGHIKRDCPKLGNREITSQLSVGQRERTQPIAAPQPAIVKDRIGAQSQAGSSANAHRGGHPGRPRTTAKVYAMTQQQAQATPEVVTGILSISNADARVLIDPGATHSFVANSYFIHLGREFKRLDIPMVVSTPIG